MQGRHIAKGSHSVTLEANRAAFNAVSDDLFICSRLGAHAGNWLTMNL